MSFPTLASRARAFQADCPKCKAKAWDRCVGKRGLRKSPHKVRFTAPIVAPKMPVQTAKPVDPNAPFFLTDAWRKLRYRALKKHGGTCQCCGRRGSAETPLHVDHIKPRSKFPEVELELDNLQVLCEECNVGKGAWDQTDWRGA